ncbi:MAG: Gx transporter family protein, partial [Butyrivibrio sp.]|nr:Gx transporter family protein [Butyrivibrio sp.]
MKPKLQTTGLLLALALVFAYVETLIPLPFGIPGMKLGLPNLMTVLLLYCYGAKEALCVNLLRIVLSGFLFGGFQSILFSLSGALTSFAGMVLLR